MADQDGVEARMASLDKHLATKIGGLLKRAREGRGLSQKELGAGVGYGAAMISAFENGTRRMKLDDLAKACIVLDRDPSYFLEGAVDRTPQVIGGALRAELATLPAEELASALNRFLDQVEAELPIHSDVPDLGHLQPEAAAREVLLRSKVTGPPVEMADICSALEVPLFWRELPDDLSAVVFSVGDDGFVIGVNETHAPVRRRFSIAHELGHAVMRHEASFYIEYDVPDAWEPPGYRYLDERSANVFAACLLMDARWVREDYAAGMRDVDELRLRYAVSPAAMGFRLQNLNLS